MVKSNFWLSIVSEDARENWLLTGKEASDLEILSDERYLKYDKREKMKDIVDAVVDAYQI